MTEPTAAELHERVVEAEEALAEAKAREAHQEFPKYVEVHESHVVKQVAPHGDAPPHISIKGFAGHHVDRDGKVTVLVHDADEEAKAMAAFVEGDDIPVSIGMKAAPAKEHD